MVRLKKPVIFGHADNDPVSVVFSFTVPDKPAYTSTILHFMHAIQNPDFLTRIMKCKTPDETLNEILTCCQDSWTQKGTWIRLSTALILPTGR